MTYGLLRKNGKELFLGGTLILRRKAYASEEMNRKVSGSMFMVFGGVILQCGAAAIAERNLLKNRDICRLGEQADM